MWFYYFKKNKNTPNSFRRRRSLTEPISEPYHFCLPLSHQLAPASAPPLLNTAGLMRAVALKPSPGHQSCRERGKLKGEACGTHLHKGAAAGTEGARGVPQFWARLGGHLTAGCCTSGGINLLFQRMPPLVSKPRKRLCFIWANLLVAMLFEKRKGKEKKSCVFGVTRSTTPALITTLRVAVTL